MDKISIIKLVVEAVASIFSSNDLKELLDDLLDKAEQKVIDSSTPYDDAILLPVFAKLRAVASIPDDIGGDED